MNESEVRRLKVMFGAAKVELWRANGVMVAAKYDLEEAVLVNRNTKEKLAKIRADLCEALEASGMTPAQAIAEVQAIEQS